MGKSSSITPKKRLQTKLAEIREKVLNYHEKMNKISAFLKKNNAPEDILINPDLEFMEFYIDKSALARLYTISMLPKFDTFAVFFGLEKDHDSLTGCFLGIDKNKNILDEHRIEQSVKGGPEAIDGEDTWIPPSGGLKGISKSNSGKDFTLKT